MSTRISKTKFRCDNDCVMEGCPGHEMEVQVQTTSDSLWVKIDGKTFFGSDQNKFEALMKCLEEIGYHGFDPKKTNP